MLSVTVLTLWEAPPKSSAIGIGFNGAGTNCGIAHILGILLMNMQLPQQSHIKIYFLAATVICSLSTLNNDCTSTSLLVDEGSSNL